MVIHTKSHNRFRNIKRCLKHDIFCRTLTEFADLEAVRLDYIQGTLWFSYDDIIHSMGLDIPLEEYEMICRSFDPVLDNSIKIYVNGPWISRDGLLHLLLFTRNSITDCFRWRFVSNRYGHEPEYGNKDYYIQLPEMYQSEQFREWWKATYRHFSV